MKYMSSALISIFFSTSAFAFCPPGCEITRSGPHTAETNTDGTVSTGRIKFNWEKGFKLGNDTLFTYKVKNADGSIDHTFTVKDHRVKVKQKKGESDADFIKRAAKEVAESGKIDEKAAEELIRKAIEKK